VTRLLLNNPKTVLFCLGCLSALAMAPVYAWPVMMIGYAVLITQLTKTTTGRQAALYAFSFFFGYFLVGLYWISSSLFVDFERWWWALPLSFAGLPFLLALFPAVIIGVAAAATTVKKFRAFVFVLALILADLARGHLFTGFPWNLPVHTWVNSDLMMATLPFMGLYGLNSVTLIAFGALALLRPWQQMTFASILMLLSFIPLQQQNETSLPKNLVMVQANIPQHEKWQRHLVDRNFNRYLTMSLEGIETKTNEPHLIIWPETAISDYMMNVPRFQTGLQDFLDRLPEESLLITGVLTFDNTNGNHYNSLIMLNRRGDRIARYDKHHLVPFGEYMPFGLDTITGFSNFASGQKPAPLRLPNGLNILPLICYESLFPGYARYPADILLNITNDAWFGDTAGPYQHFDHMRFRAAETRTPVIRLSGNGISGLIDGNGDLIALTHLNRQVRLEH